MSKTLRTLQQRKAALVADARKLVESAHAENRDLDDSETAQYDTLMASIQAAQRQIEREEALIEAERSAGVPVPENARISVSENIEHDPKRGFRSLGEFARSVHMATVNPMRADERLRYGGIGAVAPATYGGEGSGPDGGFLIPPEFSRDIFTLSLGEDALLPYTDDYDIEGNSMVFPKDETTPWGTDGIRAYWQAEANTGTATKPKLSATTQFLHKMMALVPLTDELIADGPALGQYLNRKIGDSIRWKTNDSLLFGAGNGMPIGALQGNAAIVVAKDSGQATQTLTISNLSKMIARLPPGSFGRAIWLVNNDVLPALFTLTLGNYPIYLPISAGAQESPYGMLLGRPVFVSQHAKSFSSQGDVILLDLSYYRTIKKASGIETATSMHLYFDADAMAFRTVFRLDGQPTIVNPIKPANGTNNLSPFIQLAAR
jgi:HK97 family phage major capsid protein